MKIPKVVGMEFVEWKSGFDLVPIIDNRAKVYHAVSLGHIVPDLPDFWQFHYRHRKCYVVTHWYAFAVDGDWLFDFMVVLDPSTKRQAAKAKLKEAVEFWQDPLLDTYAQLCEPDIKPVLFPSNDIAGQDVFKARLAVLKGVSPQTVKIFEESLDAKDPEERERLQREAVQAYIADGAKKWTDNEVRAWQENNPLDKKWMEAFVKSLRGPNRVLDAVNYELALNWIKDGYNEKEPKELADVIYQVTGQMLSPVAIRKRHYRKLGLMTKRKPGAKAKVGN